jgi:hypothetical protein
MSSKRANKFFFVAAIAAVLMLTSCYWFESPTYTANEDDGVAVITIRYDPFGFDAPNKANSSTWWRTGRCRYWTVNGTAVGGVDFGHVSGTMTFGPGQYSKTFVVPIFKDMNVEPDETVFLRMEDTDERDSKSFSYSGQDLKAANGYNPYTAVLTIRDRSYSTVQFSDGFFAAKEEGGFATVTVTRSGGNLNDWASVDYMTSESTETNHAQANSDFIPTFGTLIFERGMESQTFTVPIMNDDLMEGKEMINLVLANPKGVVLGNPSASVVMIMDDESPQPGVLQFSSPEYLVFENSGIAVMTVVRTDGSNMPVTIRFAATGGTATENQDFGPSTGLITFGVGETSKDIHVRIYKDGVDEGTETVVWTLYETTGGPEIGMSQAVLKIVDGAPSLNGKN